VSFQVGDMAVIIKSLLPEKIGQVVVITGPLERNGA